jgi:hypothetical protein
MEKIRIKQFETHSIKIYDNQYFKVKEIGNLLGINQVDILFEKMDENCKILKYNQYFITKIGVYELLMISIKPKAKKWMLDILTHLYSKEIAELEQYKYKKYEEIVTIGSIYIMKMDIGYKIGRTKDTTKNRSKSLQTGNLNDIHVVFEYKTIDDILLESLVHKILAQYRCKSNREFFSCKLEYMIDIIEILGNTIDTLKSTFENINRDEIIDKLGSKLGKTINKQHHNEDVIIEPMEIYQESEIEGWLKDNIIYEKDAILQLKDVASLYTGMEIVHSKESNKIKKDVELFIGSSYMDSTQNTMKYKGWLNYTLKKFNQSSEIEGWLKDNIIYEKDAILQLKDVASLYTGMERVHSKASSRIKQHVESFLESRCKNNKMTKFTLNNNSYNGWLNFTVVEQTYGSEQTTGIENWFSKHMVYKKGHMIELKDVCETFYKTINMSVKEKNRIKIFTQNYIKNNYPDVDPDYKLRRRIGGDRTIRCWVDVCLVENTT